MLHIRVVDLGSEAYCGRRIYGIAMLDAPIAHLWIGKVQPPCATCLKAARAKKATQ